MLIFVGVGFGVGGGWWLVGGDLEEEVGSEGGEVGVVSDGEGGVFEGGVHSNSVILIMV